MAAQVALVSGDYLFASKSGEMLAEEQIELQVFNPAEFAPAQLLKDRPNVLLVDIGGKNAEDGLAVIQSMRCREHLRKIPIIAVLEHASRELVLAVHQAGIREILAKNNGDATLLVEKIRQYCHAAQLPAQGARQPRGAPAQAAPTEWSDPDSTAFKKQVQREVSRRLETLPSLPMVVMAVMQLVESDKSCASDFEEHISHDPALAARILRIANSSFFGLSRTIKSIRDSIVILGFQTLKSLVMAASTGKFLNKPAEGYGYIAGGLWKHSIGVALGSRLLARKLGRGEQEAEVFFVQGLLHDIGKLLLNQFVVEKVRQFREAMEVRNLSLLETEMMVLGTDHSEVGSLIAQRWNLPREVSSAIVYHHYPRRAGNLRNQVAVVHVVNHWCHELEIGMIPRTFVKSTLDLQAAQEAGLNESTLPIHREEFSAQLSKVEELFSMIGKE